MDSPNNCDKRNNNCYCIDTQIVIYSHRRACSLIELTNIGEKPTRNSKTVATTVDGKLERCRILAATFLQELG